MIALTEKEKERFVERMVEWLDETHGVWVDGDHDMRVCTGVGDESYDVEVTSYFNVKEIVDYVCEKLDVTALVKDGVTLTADEARLASAALKESADPEARALALRLDRERLLA